MLVIRIKIKYRKNWLLRTKSKNNRVMYSKNISLIILFRCTKENVRKKRKKKCVYITKQKHPLVELKQCA